MRVGGVTAAGVAERGSGGALGTVDAGGAKKREVVTNSLPSVMVTVVVAITLARFGSTSSPSCVPCNVKGPHTLKTKMHGQQVLHRTNFKAIIHSIHSQSQR